MNFGLSDEQQMIVDTVRTFVENEMYPHEEEIERLGVVPPDLAQEIKQKCIDIGFYASNMPEEHGGGGLNHLDFTLLERELGRASMALTVFFGRPSGILEACVGDQVEKYLLPVIRGEKFDALAMTEPDAGSDVRGMKCAA
jgi:acyl-CoA dehydrogenase